MLLGTAAAQTDSTAWHQMGSDYVPTAITTTVEYDAETGDYVQVRKVGNVVLGRKYLTFEEYQDTTGGRRTSRAATKSRQEDS